MNLTQILKKNKFVYELCLYIRGIFQKKNLIKRNKLFSEMDVKDIMQYNAQLYQSRQGKPLLWDNLKSYTEKMQYEKIFNTDSRKAILSDKYLVRKWVSDLIGEEYLIPLLGVWEKYADIDFNNLPNQFVIKTNHGSSDVVIVRDKTKMSAAEKMEMRRKITTSMITDYASYACELHYSKIKPLIIIEQFVDSGDTDLMDYKFLCFDGVPYYCWVDVGRYTNHKRNVYDMDWNLQSWNQYNYGNSDEPIEKPINFDEMKKIVSELSSGFAHVRVDLYNINGKILFGEMTFTNGSGFEPIIPEEANINLGKLWNIDTRRLPK